MNGDRISKAAITFMVVASVVVLLDQASKYWAVAALTHAFDPAFGEPATTFGERFSRFLWSQNPTPARAVVVVDNYWSFIYAQNPGAAWSFLANAPEAFRRPFFLVVPIAAMIFIVYYFRKVPKSNWMLRIALMLVFGGAVGNFLDRVRLGYVIDFIVWHYHDVYRWPTFNVADSAITVGVIIMVLEMLVSKDSSKSNESAATERAKA